ncbi:MAG: hypothetical protein NZV14_07125 [Bryobacteraceae bacterium]|nr:hypothetical protein [Bryobacteraceae bacterium]MDW8377915.1 SH3 domain-containing protein [Bryobacterales bacterium]
MRAELSTRAENVAELKHGEKLEILSQRRRFLKVRNMGGVEGWVDGRALLTGQEIQELQKTIELAQRLPSQGQASVYDALNIHTQPNRSAPSPFQIPPGGVVEIVAHTVAERTPFESRVLTQLTAPRAAPTKAKGKKEKRKRLGEPDIEPPPMPRPPALPTDWELLSKSVRAEIPAPEAAAAGGNPSPKEPKPQVPAPKIKADDWYLVRTPEKKAGWVLARMMVMGIPDEVATYAEGQRITSYFELGRVNDVVNEENVTRSHWLWTTQSQGLRPFQFDGLRVFIWNTKRHRYETAYRERDLKGYYPILRHTVEITEGRRKLQWPGFTVFVEDAEGRLWKRSYVFQINRVRLIGSEPVDRTEPPGTPRSILALANLPFETPKPEAISFVEKVRGILKR